MMYNLWKNLVSLEEKKRFSTRCFQGHNMHPQEMAFVHALRYISFHLR